MRRGKNGRELEVSITVSPIKDPTGKIVGISKVVRNISERIQAARALQQREAEFRTLTEALPQIVWVTNADGGNIFFNHRWMDYTGLTLEESLGDGWNKPFHPDDRQRAWDAWQKAVAGAGDYSLECRLRRADGVYRWWWIQGAPLKAEDGTILKWFGSCSDITERRMMDEALREQEERFRTMANSIPQLACAARADGYIHWYNQRWYDYTGTTPEQMEGDGWQSVHDPEILPLVVEKWQEAISSGRPFEMEFPLRAADGSYRNFLTRVAPTKNAEGVVTHWFGTNTDVEDLREAERKVQLLNAELEQRVLERTAELEAFSYSVSHDLRAPVRAIGGFARMVQESYGAQLPPEANHKLGRIHENALKLGQLIDGLLAFSRLGHQPLSKRKVLPLTIVNHALEELQADQPGRNLQISVLELPECHADPTLLKQVFTNLISNAFKYSRERNPAIIEIGSRTETGQCVYYVKDNGAGFEPAYADKLFGVFQRLHRADQFEGTGVGLAIVQRIINRHGGKIWAESQVENGATFSFTLGNGETV